MEVSMHLNHNLVQRVHKHKPLISKINPNPISCQLSMQSGMKSNFYQLLSLNSQNVGFDEIKKAYKTMALQYHPDVCNTTSLTKEESTKRFVELRKAYEILLDPKSRRIYDSELGLEDPFGIHCVEKRRDGGGFPREVWERQLNGLRKRCGERMKKRRDL